MTPFNAGVGLFRRKDERAIPDPGTPEYEAMVEGSALPDSRGVSMGEPGWTAPNRETIDVPASKVPGLRGALLRVLTGRVPNTDGIAGGVSKKPD